MVAQDIYDSSHVAREPGQGRSSSHKRSIIRSEQGETLCAAQSLHQRDVASSIRSRIEIGDHDALHSRHETRQIGIIGNRSHKVLGVGEDLFDDVEVYVLIGGGVRDHYVCAIDSMSTNKRCESGVRTLD